MRVLGRLSRGVEAGINRWQKARHVSQSNRKPAGARRHVIARADERLAYVLRVVVNLFAGLDSRRVERRAPLETSGNVDSDGRGRERGTGHVTGPILDARTRPQSGNCMQTSAERPLYPFHAEPIESLLLGQRRARRSDSIQNSSSGHYLTTCAFAEEGRAFLRHLRERARHSRS